MSEDALGEAEIRQQLEGLIAALQVFREHAARVSVAQVQAVLVTALETMDLQRGDHLPVVGDYAQRLGLSASGASRLMANLCEPLGEGQSALLASDRGPMGQRSEAFVLSKEGRDVTVRAVEALTARSVERFSTHDFLTFAFARYGKKDAGHLTIKVISPRVILASPVDNAVSHEVLTWCDENLTCRPEIELAEEWVKLKFATDNDAFFFRMRW